MADNVKSPLLNTAAPAVDANLSADERPIRIRQRPRVHVGPTGLGSPPPKATEASIDRPTPAAKAHAPRQMNPPQAGQQPKNSNGATTGPQAANSGPRYEVGYKKPPKHTQFKKGKSGNHKGRTKGKKNLRTIFEEEIQQLVKITENGRSRKISKQEAMVRTVFNAVLRGNLKAFDIFLKLRDRCGMTDAPAPEPDGAEPWDVREYFEKLFDPALNDADDPVPPTTDNLDPKKRETD